MPRFKQHIIVYGETPQIIAEREMGDVNKWVDLVKFNNLRYPYIVDTPEERAKDLSHLVTIGNKIIIPKEKTLDDIDTTKLPKRDRNLLEQIVLGTDIKIDSYMKTINAHGAEDEIIEMTGNGKGDLELAKGYDNIKQLLLLRLLTPKGSLPLHPDYGSDIQSIIGERNNLNTADKLNDIIQDCLETDYRIKSATLINYNITENTYNSTWEVQLQSFDTYFRLLIQRDENNNFIIM